MKAIDDDVGGYDNRIIELNELCDNIYNSVMGNKNNNYGGTNLSDL